MLKQSLKEEVGSNSTRIARGISHRCSERRDAGHLGSCTGRSANGMGTRWWEMRLKEESVEAKHKRFLMNCKVLSTSISPWAGTIPWGREWLPTPVFLPGESHGQRNLMGYSPWRSRVGPDWVIKHSTEPWKNEILETEENLDIN